MPAILPLRMDGMQDIILRVTPSMENLTLLEIIHRLENLFGTQLILSLLNKVNIEQNNFDLIELKNYLFQELWLTYEMKVIELEIRHLGIIRALERTLILIYLDIDWKEHLQKMALLRDAVGWRTYGQRNPLFEYKDEAYELFKNRGLITRHLVIYDLIRSCIL